VPELTQAETKEVRAVIEVNGLRYEATGTADEIVPQIFQFLSHAVPAYDLARKLIYVSDLAALTNRIGDFAKMTNTGQLLLMRNDLAADEAILIILFMAYLADKTARRESDSLTVEEIVNGVGKAPKTVRNTTVGLQKSGFIERADRGRYKITAKGLVQLETTLLNKSRKGGVTH
jgi:hypothetical protein